MPMLFVIVALRIGLILPDGMIRAQVPQPHGSEGAKENDLSAESPQ